jgi:nicotinamide mononucleotide (NMN) deamidase PncC
VFGVDEETVESLIIDGLTAKRWTIATVERATLGLVGARIAAADHESTFAGTVFGGDAKALIPPEADVILTVGALEGEAAEGPQTTRPVKIEVTTPNQVITRVFHLAGDDERVRAFATIAGLHQIRIALEGNPARP